MNPKLHQPPLPRHPLIRAGAAALLVLLATAATARAQLPTERRGDPVPRDVREVYDRGLQYLAASQTETGEWTGGQQGPGCTGLGLLVFLASGEDPNFGPYSLPIRRSLRNIIAGQDPATGYLGNSMYHHGFAMLALAEAYGAVDEASLWADQKPVRSIGQALELAVRLAATSQQKNGMGGWRYSPESNDADTSVSGAVLVGLLAARNAGIEVPDVAIDKAIAYYRQMTAGDGSVGYSGIGGHGESLARSSIAALVYAIAHRKDLAEFKATIGYLSERVDDTGGGPYREYTRYYQAQALFQGDLAAWEKWNTQLVRQLKQAQQPDGSISGQFGTGLGTSMSLLALALNYRFLPIYER